MLRENRNLRGIVMNNAVTKQHRTQRRRERNEKRRGEGGPTKEGGRREHPSSIQKRKLKFEKKSLND